MGRGKRQRVVARQRPEWRAGHDLLRRAEELAEAQFKAAVVDARADGWFEPERLDEMASDVALRLGESYHGPALWRVNEVLQIPLDRTAIDWSTWRDEEEVHLFQLEGSFGEHLRRHLLKRIAEDRDGFLRTPETRLRRPRAGLADG